MRVAYADPPYPGCADKWYRDHPDYAGEVDHRALIDTLEQYDGWLLHTSAPALPGVLEHVAALGVTGYRIMAWVKPFAAYKRHVAVAYAWEPVLVKACRTPVVSPDLVSRDWIAESITMRRGLAGAKPDAVCRWAFHVLGLERTDELVDLYPGTGAVGRAWARWCGRPVAGDPASLFDGLERDATAGSLCSRPSTPPLSASLSQPGPEPANVVTRAGDGPR